MPPRPYTAANKMPPPKLKVGILGRPPLSTSFPKPIQKPKKASAARTAKSTPDKDAVDMPPLPQRLRRHYSDNSFTDEFESRSRRHQQAVDHFTHVLGSAMNAQGKPLAANLGFRLLTINLHNWAGPATRAVVEDYSLRWATLVARAHAFKMKAGDRMERMFTRVNARMLEAAVPYLEVGEGGLLHLHVMLWDDGELFDKSAAGRRRWNKFREMCTAYLEAVTVNKGGRSQVWDNGKPSSIGRYRAYRAFCYTKKDGHALVHPSAAALANDGTCVTRRGAALRLIEQRWVVLRLAEVRDKLEGWPYSSIRVRLARGSDGMHRWRVFFRCYARAHGNVDYLGAWLLELEELGQVVDLDDPIWRLFDAADELRSWFQGGAGKFTDARGLFATLFFLRRLKCLHKLRFAIETFDRLKLKGAYQRFEANGAFDMRLVRTAEGLEERDYSVLRGLIGPEADGQDDKFVDSDVDLGFGNESDIDLVEKETEEV